MATKTKNKKPYFYSRSTGEKWYYKDSKIRVKNDNLLKKEDEKIYNNIDGKQSKEVYNNYQKLSNKYELLNKYAVGTFHNPNKYKIWNLPTANQLNKIPELYSQENKKDKKVYMKLFTPDRTYYITEYDKKTGDFYGYLKFEGGDGESEWGYTNFNELKNAVAQSKGMYYLDRDKYFKPTKVSELRREGVIK